MINEIKGTGIQNNAAKMYFHWIIVLSFKGTFVKTRMWLWKAFLSVIDNVISLVPIHHSESEFNNYVINWYILTITCRQSFQKALKTKLGNRNYIRVGQRIFDWKVTIRIIVYNTRASFVGVYHNSLRA